jgi:hypothetical protein
VSLSGSEVAEAPVWRLETPGGDFFEPTRFQTGSNTQLFRRCHTAARPTNLTDPLGLWGVGVQLTGQFESGIGIGGVGVQGARGVARFGNGNEGEFQTYGGFGGNPLQGVGYPGNRGIVLGGSVGAGLSGFLTNADEMAELAGPFHTISINAGLLLPWFRSSFQISFDSNWTVVVAVGPPFAGLLSGPGSLSYYKTTTEILWERNKATPCKK